MSVRIKSTAAGLKIGEKPADKIGFNGAAPVAQRANVAQAVATDLPSVVALANELRASLVAIGLIKGSA